jgi:hypothetical protein
MSENIGTNRLIVGTKSAIVLPFSQFDEALRQYASSNWLNDEA